MDFFDWQGTRRRHSRRYGNNEQRRQTEKDTISCHVLGADGYNVFPLYGADSRTR